MAAHHRLGAAVEQALGGRVEAADAVIEIQDEDAGRRHLKDPAQKLMLLRQANALVTQMIDHPVVDVDQPIDIRLTDREESRRELLVADQSQALGRQPEVAIHLARQTEAGNQRRREDRFDREQPEAVVAEQVDGEAGEDQVEDDQVGDGAPAETHTAISYFTNRR